jgi:Na+-transporting NADH:ubiquinone oxidoreductase subunit NqrB
MVAAGLLGTTGLLFAWQASMLDLGDIGLPGAGFFPLVLGSAVLAFAVVIGFEGWRSTASSEPVMVGHRDVLIVFTALLAVPLMFDSLGAYPTLGLFGAALLLFVARLSFFRTVVAIGLGMVACWLFFQVTLGVQLPMGPF